MILRKGLEALDGLPILYVEDLSAIVCADLHLGYEGVMADNGVFLPKVNLKKMKEMLKRAVEMKRPNTIIVDGDIKNEFSKVHVEEFNELDELVRYLSNELGIKKIILIKGNHDNFVDRLAKPLGIKVYKQEAVIGNILFFHGEEFPVSSSYKTMVMGHVHPTVLIYNKVGVGEKLKCFVYGKAKNGKFAIILPAMNFFAEGLNMNGVQEESENTLSLFDLDNMHAACIGDGETLDFGRIKDLRLLSQR